VGTHCVPCATICSPSMVAVVGGSGPRVPFIPPANIPLSLEFAKYSVVTRCDGVSYSNRAQHPMGTLRSVSH
jgi:hypothetical protein